MKQMHSFVAAGLVAVGCARTVPLSVDVDHPANPSADAGPIPAESQTLSIVMPSTATPSAQDGAHRSHAPDSHRRAAASQPRTPSSQPVMPGGYGCPMHPEVVSDQPGRCPQCEMKLVRKGGDQ